jgi:signal transduction histidine kinase
MVELKTIALVIVLVVCVIIAGYFLLNLIEKKRAFDNLELAKEEVLKSQKMVEELNNTIEKTEKSTVKEIQEASVKAETAKKLATEAKIAYDKKMAELEEAKKNKDSFSISGIKQKSVAGGVVLAEYTQMVTTEKQATLANTILQTLKSESSKVLIGLNGQLNKAKESNKEWNEKLKLAQDAVKKYQT